MRTPYYIGVVLILFLISTLVSTSAPTTLSQAMEAALTKNLSYLQTEERLNQTDARIDQLVGGIYPNLSFNVLHTIQPTPANAVAASFSPPQQTTVNFSITQPIFRGLREFNGLSQLNRLRAAQQKSNEFTAELIRVQVAGSYLGLLTLEAEIKNVREQLTLFRDRISELSARTQRGESNRSDVISAQTTQAALIAESRLLEGQREGAREAFAVATGLDRNSELMDPKLMDGVKSIPSMETYLARVEERPDVKAAVESRQAAEKGVDMAWGAHSPSVDAYGNYYLSRPGFLSDLTWDVGVRVSFPLFEGGSTQAKITEAVSKRKESELSLAQVRLVGRQEIRSAYETLRARMDQLESLKKSVELAKQNTQLKQSEYRRGLTRNIDVQLALTEYQAIQRTFDRAYFAAQLEMIQLHAAAAMNPLSAVTTQKENAK